MPFKPQPKAREPLGEDAEKYTASPTGAASPFLTPKPCILSQEKPAEHPSFLTLLFLSFKTIPFRCWKPFFLRGPFHSVNRKLRSRAPSGGNNHFLREKRGQRLVLGEKESHIEPLTPCKPEPKTYVQTSAPKPQELIKGRATECLFFRMFSPVLPKPVK